MSFVSPNRILSIYFFLLFLQLLFGWIFSNTVYASDIEVHGAGIVLFILIWSIIFLSKGKWIIESPAEVWMPFLIYSLFQSIVNILPYRFILYGISLAILLLSVRFKIQNHIPWGIFLFCGIYSIVGIFVQCFIPDFYYSKITPLFINNAQIEAWGNFSYGYAGFAYQLQVSAMYLILCEGFLLYFFYKQGKPRILVYVLLLLVVICVFMTGKRTASIISLVVPFLIYAISVKRKKQSFFLSVVFCLLMSYIVSNATSLSETVVFNRIGESVVKAQSGMDITSGRTILWSKAIDAFWEKPIFGIGLNNYQAYTGMSTEAHNSYVQILCEEGVVGFLLFIFPLLYCAYITANKVKMADSQSAESGFLKFSLFYQLFFIIFAFTGNPTTNDLSLILYFVAVGILCSIQNEAKSWKRESFPSQNA